MKTVGGLHEQMLSHENLLRAVYLAARGRRNQTAVMAYLNRLDQELPKLRRELASGQPACGSCSTFTIYDPKQRLITAPVFAERVVHHAVMNVCGPVLDRRLIYHSYACRQGKGTFAALDAAQQAASKAAWFLKLDIRKYFESIPHDRLQASLARVFREKAVLNILAVLMTAYRPGHTSGLAIGTLISQHLANFYLSVLDTKIVQQLRPIAYVRYMDDMALWTAERDRVKDLRMIVSQFLAAELKLDLKTAFINRTTHGMDFLGHRVHPHRLGMNRASKCRYRTRIKRLHADWANGSITEDEAQEKGNALTAFTSHAHGFQWRQRFINDLENEL